jgi:hypothetical protein
MVPLGYLLLRLWPRVGILPVVLQLIDPLERRACIDSVQNAFSMHCLRLNPP